MSLVSVTRRARKAVDALSFGEPVAWVYNPLAYAWKSHAAYLERYGSGDKEVLLLGMNPGPFGMVQTGVPFGEVDAVRRFLGITEKVGKPDPEHPKRPVLGFDCERSEVSGRRLWNWVEERFGKASRFFDRFYVHNYCPLVFMEDGGRNVTPDKLKAEDRAPLFEICDRFLRDVVATVKPRMVVGVGAFAESRARAILGDAVEYGRLPHPSPASPAANRGWDKLANAAFDEMGL